MGKHFWLESLICLPLLLWINYRIDTVEDIYYDYGVPGIVAFIALGIFCLIWSVVLASEGYADSRKKRREKEYYDQPYSPSYDANDAENMTDAMLFFTAFPEADYYIDKDGGYWDSEFFGK